MEDTSSGSGPHVLRWLNASAVLGVVRAADQATLSDLMEATGLTRPTVAQAVATLERAGWIEILRNEADGGARRIGRPAQRVRFRAEAGHLVGVDVGPHKTMAIVTDLAGTVLAQVRHEIDGVHQGGELATDVLALTESALGEAGVAPESVAAIGVGTPGVVADGEVLMAPSIPGWAGNRLGADLTTRFDCPVLIDNDVNLAVLAENWHRRGGPEGTLAFVHWGARLGAGLLIGGRLHRGHAASAGEIGFLDLDEEPRERLSTDRMGPLESIAGAEAIAALAESVVRRRRTPLRELLAARTDPLDVSPIFHCAAEGDPVALSIVDTVAARFARGLAPLFLLLDPDLVIIGGGVSRGGPVLLDAVERHVRRRTLVPPRLEMSELGDAAVALGGVRLALDRTEETLFSAAGLSAEG
ncbi:ROK family transcriptional regulator [Dactylosporangium sp. CA-092794]|uniref:ROK family transcriptional regulator n=1 Tax=Dactylosporangium sp. CA-092794 TaxID=3239929 RepID=UPI003D8C261A